jgi:hypothetical protein
MRKERSDVPVRPWLLAILSRLPASALPLAAAQRCIGREESRALCEQAREKADKKSGARQLSLLYIVHDPKRKAHQDDPSKSPNRKDVSITPTHKQLACLVHLLRQQRLHSVQPSVHLQLQHLHRHLMRLDRRGASSFTLSGGRRRVVWRKRGKSETRLEPGFDGEEDGKDLGVGCFVLERCTKISETHLER